MVENTVLSAAMTSILHNTRPQCPKLSCKGKMEPDPRMGTTKGLGLAHLVCPVCKHTGYRSLEGIRVLFATRHEYVCSYGPSLKSLTVVFTSAALTFLRDKELCQTQSALFAAHWALLCGQLVGIVRVTPDSPVFLHCYSYLQREIVSTASGQSTDAFQDARFPFPQDVTSVESAMRGLHSYEVSR